MVTTTVYGSACSVRVQTLDKMILDTERKEAIVVWAIRGFRFLPLFSFYNRGFNKQLFFHFRLPSLEAFCPAITG